MRALSVVSRSLATTLLLLSMASRISHAGLLSKTQEIDHSLWDEVLQSIVIPFEERDGILFDAVNYDLLKINRDLRQKHLDYIDMLARIDIESLPKKEAIAFMINAYNAFTVDLVVKENVKKSIRELSDWFRGSVFNRFEWELIVGGAIRKVTLSDIEHQIIRNSLTEHNEPRMFAALNFASLSCPDLRAEAYTGQLLDDQLGEQMIMWMENESKGLFLDKDSNEIHMSAILHWFKEDFVSSHHGGMNDLIDARDPLEYAMQFAPSHIWQYVRHNHPTVKIMPHNWGLITPSQEVVKFMTENLDPDSHPAANKGGNPGMIVEHSLWDDVLSSVVISGVERDGIKFNAVDFDLLRSDPALRQKHLDYMEMLSVTDMDDLTDYNEALAFLINAYNAFTVDLIVKENVRGSIRDLTDIFKGSVFDRFKWDLTTGGSTQKFSLNNIEHKLIRKQLTRHDEPRVHAGVNCVSLSCPNLRPEAYTGAKLDEQLEEQMKNWMQDKGKGIRLDKAKNEIHMSAILEWFSEDFVATEHGGKNDLIDAKEPLDYAVGFLAKGVRKFIKKNEPTLKYMSYNWDLISP